MAPILESTERKFDFLGTHADRWFHDKLHSYLKD